jgi:hypothetical protein
MNYSRCALLASLVIAAGSILGCGDSTKGMPNMQQGSGPPVQKDLPIKKGNKPMPAEPSGPKAPP